MGLATRSSADRSLRAFDNAWHPRKRSTKTTTGEMKSSMKPESRGMSRDDNTLLVVGAIGLVVGLLAYLTVAIHAARYLPGCQQSPEEWSRSLHPELCRSLVVRVWCSIAVIFASLILLTIGLAQIAPLMAQAFARDRAWRLAKFDTDAALDAARRIPAPLYKCQALAGVARYAANESLVLRLAEEAARTVEDGPNPYHAVFAVAWPIGALVERGYTRKAEAMLRRAVVTSEQITDPASRVDALFLLAQANWSSGGDGWAACVDHLMSAARSSSSPKIPHVLWHLVVMLAGTGRDFGPTLANMPEGRDKRHVERLLQGKRKRFVRPREFFR